MALFEQTILQRFIGPFEIERKRDCLTHADILKHLATEIEHKARGRRRQPVGKLCLDHIALLNRREIIPRGPGFRIALGAEGIDAGLEGLEGCIVIGKIFDADGIEIMPPLVDRQITAPIVGVALIDDIAVHVIACHLIRSRTGGGIKTRLVKAGAGFLVPGLGKDRRAANLINQRAA